MIKWILTIIALAIGAGAAYATPLTNNLYIDAAIGTIAVGTIFAASIWMLAKAGIWFAFASDQLDVARYPGGAIASFISGTFDVDYRNGQIGKGVETAEEFFGGIRWIGLFAKIEPVEIKVATVTEMQQKYTIVAFSSVRERIEMEGIATGLEINYGSDGTGTVVYSITVSIVDAKKMITKGIGFSKIIVDEVNNHLIKASRTINYKEFLEMKITEKICDQINKSFLLTGIGSINKPSDIGVNVELFQVKQVNTTQADDAAKIGELQKKEAAKLAELQARKAQKEQEAINAAIDNEIAIAKAKAVAETIKLKSSAEYKAKQEYVEQRITTLKAAGLTTKQISEVLATDETYQYLQNLTVLGSSGGLLHNINPPR